MWSLSEISSLSFVWPWAGLALLLPFFVHKKGKAEENFAIHFPAFERLSDAFGTAPSAFKPNHSLRNFLFWLMWASLTLALMKPELVDEKVEVKTAGYDLMLAVDLSKSMTGLDFDDGSGRLNRLEITKRVVADFVKARRGDRVGLVVFGSQAYLHVPLTTDTLSVGETLSRTVIGMAGESTAIGDAIGIAVKSLRERPEGSRVLILLTDGENTAGTLPPMEAAKIAQKYGVKIYTIGVGSNNLVPVPGPFGRLVNVQMTLDEKLLTQIARATGGQYFNATNARALSEIYGRINELEKTKSEVKAHLLRTPLFHYPLTLALLLFGLILLTHTWRRSWAL